MAAALKLEGRWSKQRILAEYMNRCEYGNRLAGPEAASRWYFGKSASELSLGEAIYLAGLPRAPTRLNPWTHPDAAASRYAYNLDKLARQSSVTADQAKLLIASPIHAGRFIPPSLAPHFVQALRSSHPGLSGIVRTTLDLDLQRVAEQYARQHLRTLNRNDVTGAAVVILDNHTGAVRALVGSPDWSVSQVNCATLPRSCGSTLKPFVYLQALDRRLLTAASILPDTPDAIRDAFSDYDPQDYNRRYLGPVRVREALASSLNVPAVVTLAKVGARQAFFELKRWGFSFPRGLDDYGAGFILGNAEVRLLDLTGAYATLARGGVMVTPRFLEPASVTGGRLASSEAAQIISDILADNEARSPAFGPNSPLNLGARVPVKTGTSSGFRDAWTVGFTREHTVGVWVGNPGGRPCARSSRSAAPRPFGLPLCATFCRPTRRFRSPCRALRWFSSRSAA